MTKYSFEYIDQPGFELDVPFTDEEMSILEETRQIRDKWFQALIASEFKDEFLLRLFFPPSGLNLPWGGALLNRQNADSLMRQDLGLVKLYRNLFQDTLLSPYQSEIQSDLTVIADVYDYVIGQP